MWLFTKYGFYSVVAVEGDPGWVQVRARIRGDIEALAELVRKHAEVETPIIETDNSDYRFRVVLERKDWEEVARFLVEDIDYSNFKGQIAANGSEPERLRAYHSVWATMAKFQDTMA